MHPTVFARLIVFGLAAWLLARQYLDPETAEWMRNDPDVQALVVGVLAYVPDLAGGILAAVYAVWYWLAKKFKRPT